MKYSLILVRQQYLTICKYNAFYDLTANIIDILQKS